MRREARSQDGPEPAGVQRKITQAQLDGMKAIEPKLQAFYASLDDKQKRSIDAGSRVGGLFGWLNC